MPSIASTLPFITISMAYFYSEIRLIVCRIGSPQISACKRLPGHGFTVKGENLLLRCKGDNLLFVGDDLSPDL